MAASPGLVDRARRRVRLAEIATEVTGRQGAIAQARKAAEEAGEGGSLTVVAEALLTWAAIDDDISQAAAHSAQALEIMESLSRPDPRVLAGALNQAAATSGVRFAFSLAYFGFFITLFNLIPILPLDGGRVTSAISKWFNLAGLVILGALVVSEVLGYSLGNPILILIFVIAIYSVWGRFRAARRGAEAPPLPARTRVLIGAGYVALVAMSGVFMTLSVAWLNAHGLVLN